jgi:hypothetical protein
MPRPSGRAASSKATPAKPAAKSAPPAGTNFPVIKTKAIIDAVQEYFLLKADEKRLKARLEVLKGMIEPCLEGAPRAFAGDRIVSITTVDGSPGTPNRTITKEMIGEVIPGAKPRAGYTQMKVE